MRAGNNTAEALISDSKEFESLDFRTTGLSSESDLRWASARKFQNNCTCPTVVPTAFDSLADAVKTAKDQLSAAWKDIDTHQREHAFLHLLAALETFACFRGSEKDIEDFDRMRLAALYLAHEFSAHMQDSLSTCCSQNCESCNRICQALSIIAWIEGRN